MISTALKASKLLEEQGTHAGNCHIRIHKPIDDNFRMENGIRCHVILTMEVNVVSGGLGDRVSRFFMKQNWQINNRLLNIGLPDRFISHGARSILLEIAGLTPDLVTKKIEDFVINNQGKLLKQLF